MKTFNRGNKFGKRDFGRSDERPERRSFGRPSGSMRFGRRDSEKNDDKDSGFKLHQAVCDKCGKECDVPFKPTSNKPIYCRACFRENNSQGSGGRAGFDRNASNNRSESFESPAKPKFNPSEFTSDDLDKINRKLDKIMKALKIE